MSSNTTETITVTLCNPETGASESMPVAPTMPVSELMEFSKALLGMQGDNLILVKDGQPLVPSAALSQAGVQNGDLLVIMGRPRPAPAAPPAQAAGTGGLDFSSLLASAHASSSSSSNNNNDGNDLVYFAGMTLADAVESNPHPKAIVKLLQQHENLFKELNYHNPVLARKLQNQPYDKAVIMWREDMVKGSISTSFRISQVYHKEQDMTKRLATDPNDDQAKTYFDSKRKKGDVDQQYRQAMQEYPESMGRVLMLYVEAHINNHSLQAFVDSGAQTTIMSKKCAKKCGILELVDTRFAGVAVGVGTGKILGRIHIVQLKIGHTYFPCSVTVMDDMTLGGAPPSKDDDGAPKPKDMDFLLGLDMLKRHLCSIDLEQQKLKFRLGPGQYLETPFLHEKDLDESKGGTKGFNAEKANQELEDAQRKYDEKNQGNGGEGDNAMEE